MYDAAPFERFWKRVKKFFFGSELIDAAFQHFRQDALNLTKRFNKVCIRSRYTSTAMQA